MKKKMQFLSSCQSRLYAHILPRNLHDAECKRGLEHGTLSVNVQTVAISRDVEKPQVGAVRAVRGPV